MSGLQTRREWILGAAGATLAGALAPASRVFAQSAPWPAKPIKIIVAFPPGGLTDAYARLYAEQFTAKYGIAAVVENKPGAGGNIAIEAMTKSPPDGHTLLCSTTGSVWQNRVLYRKLPFDLAKDVAPIVLFPSGPLVLAVASDVPVKTFAELIDYLKKNPSTMASYAPASYPHLIAEGWNRDYGTKVQAIQYKGEAPMWVDVASGQVKMGVGSYQAFATVQARGVRPIAVTGNYRSPKLPDVPTLIEAGMKGELVSLEGGLPLTTQSAVPDDIIQKLAAVAVEAADSPRSKALRESFAIPNKVKDTVETRRMWREDAPIWIRNTEALGIKLD